MERSAAGMIRAAVAIAATFGVTACAGFWTTPEQRAHIPGTAEYLARTQHMPFDMAAALVALRAAGPAVAPRAPGFGPVPRAHENPIFSLTVRDGLLYQSRASTTPLAVMSGTATHDGPVIP